MDVDSALAIAGDADYWELQVRFGTDISFAEGDSGEFQLFARMFNTIIEFVPPTAGRPSWSVLVRELDEDEDVGDVPVPQVIDVVAQSAEPWVLRATRDRLETLEYRVEEEDEGALRDAAVRLRSELEQGEAHSAKWSDRAASRYGDLFLYDFPAGADLVREEVTEDGRPALNVDDAEHPRVGRVLVAPDARHPWRWSDPGRVEDYGERLTVAEAKRRAGEEYEGWVREHTAFALGETLRDMRKVQDTAMSGTDPEALRELGRLAGHARDLAEGLQPPLV